MIEERKYFRGCFIFNIYLSVQYFIYVDDACLGYYFIINIIWYWEHLQMLTKLATWTKPFSWVLYSWKSKLRFSDNFPNLFIKVQKLWWNWAIFMIFYAWLLWTYFHTLNVHGHIFCYWQHNINLWTEEKYYVSQTWRL